MLNDISRSTRISIFAQMFGGGLMIGAILGGVLVMTRSLAAGLLLLLLGIVVQIIWAISVFVWTRRADERLRADVVAGSQELVSGAVSGATATGRVVRRRIARSSPAFLNTSPVPLPSPATVVVATVLASDGPRRVAALVPGNIGLAARKAPVVVVLHPHRREVAVLDMTPDPAVLAGIPDDPRWDGEDVPSDRSVVGGYGPLLGVALLGLLAGLAVDAVLVALLAL